MKSQLPKLQTVMPVVDVSREPIAEGVSLTRKSYAGLGEGVVSLRIQLEAGPAPRLPQIYCVENQEAPCRELLIDLWEGRTSGCVLTFEYRAVPSILRGWIGPATHGKRYTDLGVRPAEVWTSASVKRFLGNRGPQVWLFWAGELPVPGEASPLG